MDLIEKQLNLMTRISNAYINFAKPGKAKMTKGGCITRIEGLKENWEKFLKNHDKLMDDDDVDYEDNYFKSSVFDTVEELYLDRMGLFQDFLLNLEPDQGASGSAQQVQQEGDSPFQAKLPPISLGTFSGDIQDWPNFRDTFQEMVVKRAQLANVYKMNYLRGCLQGEAAELLTDCSTSGDFFNSAWSTVKNYYENSRLLTSKLLSKLFAMKAMESDSAAELCRVRTGTNNILQGLKTLGSPIDTWDNIVVFMTVSKLTVSLQGKWEESVAESETPKQCPTYKQSDEFLETKRIAYMQLDSARSVSGAKENKSKEVAKNQNQSKEKGSKTALLTQNEQKEKKVVTCAICKQSHFIMSCHIFKSKSPVERKQLVTSKRLCYNCLSKHLSTECTSTKRCTHCTEKHHTMLHIPEGATPKTGNNSCEQVPTNTPKAPTVAAHIQDSESSAFAASKGENQTDETVFLATAWVSVSSDTSSRLARAIIDQGAQSSFITERLCQSLKLKRKPVRVPVTVLGNEQFTCKGVVKVSISPRFESNYVCEVTAFVISKITSYNPSSSGKSEWDYLKGIPLADPHFNRPGSIDILLGSEVHARIIEAGLLRDDSREGPIAMETLFGWVISGSSSSSARDILPHISINLQSSEIDLNSRLRSFWELEEIPPGKKILSEAEIECVEFYKNTVTRTESGSYIVRLPRKKTFPADGKLGESYNRAHQMLLTLEKKFVRDPALKNSYTSNMRDFVEKGYMRPIFVESVPRDECFFLPHHGVSKFHSLTTKLRTVFNASMKTSSGHSLNDFLHIGPNLLPELFDLITQWRCYPYVFVADIEKMFLQILIHPDDQHLQALLWREDMNDLILIYFLLVLTFGYASSPFLAIMTLKQLAEDEGKKLPLGKEVVEDETYMDDVVSGGFSVDEAAEKQSQTIQLLARGGFKLHKWLSNTPELLTHLPKGVLASENALELDSGFSILGISWCPAQDFFRFRLSLDPCTEPITKRVVLSKIAKIFDPIGWITPVIIKAKIFMQSLWLTCKSWDEALPLDLRDFWLDWYSALSSLNSLSIPRYIGVKNTSQVFEIHGYADASKAAYAAVVYLRILNLEENSVQVSILGAKARVAPIKSISSQKLELLAAVSLAKLAKRFGEKLKIPQVEFHLWTDCRNVLYWLREPPSKWPTFVANKCAEVATYAPDAFWHHINSADNPADIASRGCSAIQILEHELWWRGPARLREHCSGWKRESDFFPEQKEAKLREEEGCAKHSDKLTTLITSKNQSVDVWDLVTRYSSLSKLLRITTYILKFVGNCLKKVKFQDRISEVLKNSPVSNSPAICNGELRFAHILWSHLTQKALFNSEMQILQKGERLPKSHPWSALNPTMLDGMIRVGGRLRHSDLNEDEKHPIILPMNSTWTKLLIQYYHMLSMHGGIQLTLSCIRKMYWILKGRLAVKNFVNRCIPCTRYRAPQSYQMMGDLPKVRVTPTRPFLHTGLDYAGPFMLKASEFRGQKAYKGYFVVLVCTSTKAAHIEAVSDYSARKFIEAYKRFTSRRGPCVKLFSDQGTNFVGADAELRRMFKRGSEFSSFVGQSLIDLGTEWSFNPPAAPHFGGLWEAAVKSVKLHLKKTVGDTKLTFEGFQTLLSQVEACLNSRPICPLSDEPTDMTALTPAHFLIGSPSLLLPEPLITEEKVAPLHRWRLVTQMVQKLWIRWSSEYLQQLQKRHKWRTPKPSYTVGDLVLIRHENTPPSRWPLGRITDLHPGADGLPRVATIRTANSTLDRPIVKLILLRREDDEFNN